LRWKCVQMVSVSSSWSTIHHLSALVTYRRHSYWRLAKVRACRPIRLQRNRSSSVLPVTQSVSQYKNTRSVPDNIWGQIGILGFLVTDGVCFATRWNFKVILPHCVLSSITSTILPVKTQLFICCTIQLNVPAVEYRYASLNDGDTTFWEVRRWAISSSCERHSVLTQT
jgi:hypothetical protein